jgi:hypothetical protein
MTEEQTSAASVSRTPTVSATAPFTQVVSLSLRSRRNRILWFASGMFLLRL